MVISSVKLINKSTVHPAIKKLFHTKEGQVSRTLNKVAKHKNIPQYFVPKTRQDYPLASPNDIKLLLSESKKSLRKSCTYLTPQNLQEYTILETNRTQNSIAVKILDNKGKLVKVAKIRPFNVVVIDNFTSANTRLASNTMKVPHGEIVKNLIERNNPFNNYEFIDACKTKDKDIIRAEKVFENLLERVEKGEKIDIISCSFATCYLYEQMEAIISKELRNKSMIKQKKILKNFFKNFQKLSHKKQVKLIKENFSDITDETTEKIINNVSGTIKQAHCIEKLNKLGVKTFMSAGNSAEIINNKFYDAINLNLLAKGTRGVGALDETGKKIAEYSSSRKSNLTQNYENGTVLIEFRDKGLNITSSKGIDIPYNQKTKELLREILDLTPNSPELKKIDDEIYQYKDVYLYRCDNDFTPYVIQITGTSWATPRRVAEYTKYKQFQNLLE